MHGDLHGFVRGGHLYVFVLRCLQLGSSFWSAKSVFAWLLDCPLLKLLLLNFQWVKGQIAAEHSQSVDFGSSKVTLISGPVFKRGLDHLTEFWSWSQMLHHQTYKWLPLSLQCGNKVGRVKLKFVPFQVKTPLSTKATVQFMQPPTNWTLSRDSISHMNKLASS